MESKEQTPAVDDNTPMTLAQACTEIFCGMIKPSTLRAEAARGRLVIERIGRRDFVTRAGVKEMRRLCQVPREKTQQQVPKRPEGESLAAAYAIVERLKSGRLQKLPGAQMEKGRAPVTAKPNAYTPSSLAERWSCSERHIRNMVKRGDIPAFQFGGKLLRIRTVDVEAYEAGAAMPLLKQG